MELFSSSFDSSFPDPAGTFALLLFALTFAGFYADKVVVTTNKFRYVWQKVAIQLSPFLVYQVASWIHQLIAK